MEQEFGLASGIKEIKLKLGDIIAPKIKGQFPSYKIYDIGYFYTCSMINTGHNYHICVNLTGKFIKDNFRVKRIRK
jgi:hypothetical protein